MNNGKVNFNQYQDTMAPWKHVKENKAEAAKTIYTALKAIDSLKVLFDPSCRSHPRNCMASSVMRRRSSASNMCKRSATRSARIRD